MTNPYFSGPIAPERNPPIMPQYFQPSRFVITALSYGLSTTVTTSVNHNYVIGQEIRLLIPFTYGANPLNEQSGIVTSLPSANQVVVNINSLNANAFVSSPSYGPTKPQIVAIGDVNTGPTNTGRTGNQTYINGSFLNIS